MKEMKAERDRLREVWRDYWQGHRKHYESLDWRKLAEYPPMPDEIADLTCGARTRAGTPCKRRDLYYSGRCSMHGGLSTGPTTSQGKDKVRENGRSGGRPKVDGTVVVGVPDCAGTTRPLLSPKMGDRSSSAKPNPMRASIKHQGQAGFPPVSSGGETNEILKINWRVNQLGALSARVEATVACSPLKPCQPVQIREGTAMQAVLAFLERTPRRYFELNEIVKATGCTEKVVRWSIVCLKAIGRIENVSVVPSTR